MAPEDTLEQNRLYVMSGLIVGFFYSAFGTRVKGWLFIEINKSKIRYSFFSAIIEQRRYGKLLGRETIAGRK